MKQLLILIIFFLSCFASHSQVFKVNTRFEGSSSSFRNLILLDREERIIVMANNEITISPFRDTDEPVQLDVLDTNMVSNYHGEDLMEPALRHVCYEAKSERYYVVYLLEYLELDYFYLSRLSRNMKWVNWTEAYILSEQ